ncbi:unnamed protein product, partial [Onchocerca ochengi]
KNTAANISMLDNNWLSTKFRKQNSTQKLSSSDKSDNDSDKISDYSTASSDKLAPSLTATTSEYTSGPSTVRNLTKNFEKNLITETHKKNSSHKTSESDPKMLSNNSTDISSGDKNNAENDNNTSSTARTVSSEFSSEASTVTELQPIK